MSASATIVGNVSITKGNSWDLNWTDTSDNVAINGFEAVIVGASGATFDLPISVGLPGWTGILANPDLTYATGPANGSGRSVTLSFSDPQIAAGVKVDIFETYNGVVVDNQAWQWLNLSANTGTTEGTDWAFISTSAYVPVPEATTMLAGALLLLPLGASTLRILRKNRIG
jgi:hypothetical protein